MKIFAVATALILSSIIPHTYARTVTAAQFGAIPDDGKNDADALRQAAKYCREHAGTTLVIAPGVYDYADTTAQRIEREAISGAYGCGPLDAQHRLFRHNGEYVKGLDLTGCKNINVEAEGATLRMHGWYEVITLERAQNVKIRGLAVTYSRPPATNGRIIASGPEYFDVRLDPECIYLDSIVTGRMYLYDTRRQCLYNTNIGEMTMLSRDIMRVKSSGNPAVGDFAVLRHGGHYRAAIFIKEARDITIEGVKILSHPGMGIVGHLSENILIDGLQVVPEPGKYCSTNTDATHFTSCSGTITIRNCTFRGNGDDCTNIHNYYYCVYPQSEKSAELRIEGADLHALSLDYPLRGDTMIAVNRRNMKEMGRYVVAKADTSHAEWKVVVTFTQPLSIENPEECYMTNISRVPKAIITGNTVNSHSARAFLIKTPNAYIARNTITNSMMTAIKLGGELSWREAGPVHDIIIEDNYIYNCSRDLPDSDPSCILTSTEALETPPQANRNIIIRNNIFVTDKPTAIMLNDARDVTIENNRINNDNFVKQNNCSNVIIR